MENVKVKKDGKYSIAVSAYSKIFNAYRTFIDPGMKNVNRNRALVYKALREKIEKNIFTKNIVRIHLTKAAKDEGYKKDIIKDGIVTAKLISLREGDFITVKILIVKQDDDETVVSTPILKMEKIRSLQPASKKEVEAFNQKWNAICE